ncbi:MAG: FAD-dependent monooxygenase [Rhizobiales bacterium]|nr:FAD-dependent monooxygenase [Hyphomicrobiales bacterium]
MLAQREKILVVGMGPVGMTAALALGRLGLPVTLLEKGADLSTESRASTFHPSSLEILDELGVAEEVIATGLKAPGFQYRGRNRELIAHLDMGLLAEDTRFPFRIQNEQGNLTRIIRRHLEKLPNVTMRYAAPVDRVEVSDKAAYVYLPEDGLDPSYVADWVIAADGASSAVRRSLGIAFDGVTYPERFLVASTTHDFLGDFEDLSYVSYVYDPDDWGVLLRTPRHWRVLFPIYENESDTAALDPARVEERLQGVVRLAEPYPVVHSTIYKVHQRIAARFAQGRVLLAGDAAHINNPLGGLGMNSGIQDAHAAVMAIRSALEGNDPQRVVEVYARVRRDAAAKDVQIQTQRNYDEMRDRDAAQRRERKEQMAALARDPVKARAYLRQTSMLASFDTSRRRMRRGLEPVRAPVVPPAGRRLSDSIAEAPLIDPAVAVRVAGSGSGGEVVAAAERDDVGLLVIPVGGEIDAGRFADAHKARREVMLLALVPANGLAAARAAAGAGADLVGVEGFPGADALRELRCASADVPLALLDADTATLPDPTDLALLGVSLVIPDTGKHKDMRR